MEQEIRFCTTSDGVRIAYATVGQGTPVVRVLGWFTHLEFEWQYPLWRGFIDAVSARNMLVRYDGRGMGLSDRDVQDLSSAACLRDLEAVVDALGAEKVVLYAISQGGPTAIAYTVKHPERVSRLIFYGSFARSPFTHEQFATMQVLIRQGWGSDVPAHRQFFTGLFMPDADAGAIQAFNELQRVSATADNVLGLLSAPPPEPLPVTLLPLIKAPALVVHRRGDAVVPFERGRELAAGIPGARFLPLDGRNHVLLPGEPAAAALWKAVDEFLGTPAKEPPPPPSPSGLVTILFTDMEGSTTLTQHLGDAAAQEVLRAHNTVVRDALRAHAGNEIKHTGDGIMASFGTASKALECAVAIQQAFAASGSDSVTTAGMTEPAEHPILPAHPEEPRSAAQGRLEGRAEHTPIRVRIGLNAGEPVAEDNDIFGTAVQLAARVCAKAEPGQILAANVVRELAAGKGFLFSDRGDVALRGFEDPVRLYEVRW